MSNFDNWVLTLCVYVYFPFICKMHLFYAVNIHFVLHIIPYIRNTILKFIPHHEIFLYLFMLINNYIHAVFVIIKTCYFQIIYAIKEFNYFHYLSIHVGQTDVQEMLYNPCT